MSYLNKIEALNSYNKEDKIALIVDGKRLGQIKKEYLPLCIKSAFNYKKGVLEFKECFSDFNSRSYALDMLANLLLEQNILPKLKREKYALSTSLNAKPYALLDRSISTFLGVLSYGQHLNGIVRKSDGLYMWIGTRAKDKGYCNGMLDHLVGGGLPYGIDLYENLAKECYEEAGISKELARRAKAVGIVSYWHEYELGGKEDIIFCYDLELPKSFVPQCTDGEVEKFELMPIKEVANIVKNQWAFKPNCELVIIDFLLRWGYIDHTDKDYIDIARSLRR